LAKVLVVGAGPAGLAAAEALLDGAPGIDVEVLSLEPYLGGNAAAFPTADGRVVEQGLHCWFGFYEQMAGLLARAGVDIRATSTSGNGEALVWEARDGRTHRLYFGPHTPWVAAAGLRYSGLTLAEKARVAMFFARAVPGVLAGVAEASDDECFTAWCLARGLPESVAATRLWRITREGQFNAPGEISAYPMLQTLRVMCRDFSTSEFRFAGGAMSRIWWDPVGARIESLGGRIRTRQELWGVEHDGARLTGLRFRAVRAAPVEDFLEHPFALEPGSERVERCFDAAVLAIPPAAWQPVIAADPSLQALGVFANVARMRTVVPLGLHVWHRAAPRWGPRSFVLGLDLPLGAVVDVKPFHPSYRDDPRFGSVLHFVGPGNGWEDWSEEALVERAMASLARVRGHEHLTMEGVRAWKLERHHGPHRRYWCSEPGSVRFKPRPRGPLEGLFLAGDWVRNELDFPCMEAAIRSGRAAAREALADLGHRNRA
jgi:uncharacterized protein with NAD-binding domain and iron-sulfur cluster